MVGGDLHEVGQRVLDRHAAQHPRGGRQAARRLALSDCAAAGADPYPSHARRGLAGMAPAFALASFGSRGRRRAPRPASPRLRAASVPRLRRRCQGRCAGGAVALVLLRRHSRRARPQEGRRQRWRGGRLSHQHAANRRRLAAGERFVSGLAVHHLQMRERARDGARGRCGHRIATHRGARHRRIRRNARSAEHGRLLRAHGGRDPAHLEVDRLRRRGIGRHHGLDSAGCHRRLVRTSIPLFRALPPSQSPCLFTSARPHRFPSRLR